MANVWHYKDAKGNDVIKEWALGVPKRQLIKLQGKIDMLMLHGSNLPPQLLADSGIPNIKKLRIQGNPKLRPLLCMICENDGEEEFVLLVGAYERGSKYAPANALADATIRREEVLKDENRKTKHVRLTKRH